MQSKFKKFILILMIFLLAFGGSISSVSALEEDEGLADEVIESTDPSDTLADREEPDVSGEQIDMPAPNAAANTSPGTAAESTAPEVDIQRIAFAPRGEIILNATDQRYIDNLNLLLTAYPYLEGDYPELARLSGIGEEAVLEMMIDEPDQFQKLVDETKAKYFNETYLKERLMSGSDDMLIILSQALGINENSVLNQLNTPSQRENIETAIDDILKMKVDKRVIDTLNYLVRPKDDPRGGAGHLRVKIFRLFRNYTRTEESNESDATRQQAEQSSTPTTPAADQQTIEQYRAEDPEGAVAMLGEAGLDQNDAVALGEIRDGSGQEVTDFAITDQDLAKNISAHSQGMAIDISEIDQIKCTLIKKRRIGSDKKIPQRPTNIKLQWQTTEGFSKDQGAIDSSFNQMFMNDARSSMLEMLSSLDVDFENIDEISANNFSEMAALVGQAFFANALNTTGDDSIWKFNLSDILRKIGGVILADGLSLDRSPFLDTTINSIDDLSIAVGRYGIEKKLQLPYGSMSGTSREEVFKNIGKERIAKELGLPAKTLQFAPRDHADLYQRIGSRIIESEFALPEGSFYNKTGMASLRESVNEYKLKAILAFPASVDSMFYLTEGTTSALVSGRISVKDFVDLIAKAHLGQIAYAYSNFIPRGNSDPFGWCDINILYPGGLNDVESCLQWRHYASTYANQPTDGQYINWRDEMFNFPEGTMDKLLGDSLAITDQDYRRAGIYSIVNILEPNDEGRENLTQWFDAPNTSVSIEVPVELPEGSVLEDTVEDGEGTEPDEPITETVPLARSSYASNLGIQPDDFFRIFGSSSNTSGIFKRIGEKTIADAIKNSQYVERKTQELRNSNSALGNLLREFEFYKARVDAIKEHLPLARERINEVTTALQSESISQELVPQRIRDNYRQLMDDFTNATNSAQNVNPNDVSALTSAVNVVISSSDSLNAETNSILAALQSSAISGVNSTVNKINAMNMEIELIARNAYEIITGDEQPNFRIESLNASSVTSRLDQDLGDVRVGQGELLLFLAGKLTLKDYLLSVGSAKLAAELKLPPKAFKYAAKIIESMTGKGNSNIKDAFFRAFGMAALEESVTSTTNQPTENVFDDSAQNYSDIVKTRDQIAERAKVTTAVANAILAEALGLKGFDLEALMLDSFGAWQQARPKAQANDLKNHLPTGTTESFILGKAFGESESEISDADIRVFSSRLHISEAAVKAFIEARNGRENPAINKIYFVDSNDYIPRTGVSEGTCAVYANPNDSGELLGHSAYYYFDRDGLHTFQSYQSANEYAIAHKDREISYMEEFSYSISAALQFTQMDTSEEGRTNASELVGESPSNVDNYIMNIIKSQGEPIQLGSQENIMDPGAPSNYGRIIDDYLTTYSSESAVKQNLENFISDKTKQEAFTDSGDGVSHMAEILHIKLGIPENATESIFTRSTTQTTKMGVDFFKISGYNLLRSFMTAYLNNALGIAIGEEMLTPSDIYSIFNGQSREVFARIGGSILDEELGLEQGTSAMLLSTHREERECAMAQAASQLVGDLIGVPGLDLESLVTNSFGPRSIEQALGFGTGTYKGATIRALATNVGELNFIKAFSVPYPKYFETNTDDILKQIGDDYYNVNQSKDFFDKTKAIYNYIQGLDSSISNDRYSYLRNFSDSIKTDLNQAIDKFLEFSNLMDAGVEGRDEIYNLVYSVSDNGYEVSFANQDEFNSKYAENLNRLTNIDSIFKISNASNKTSKLIAGKITPSQYADHFRSIGLADAAIRIVAEKAGITEKGITDGELNAFVAAIRAIASGESVFAPMNTTYLYGSTQVAPDQNYASSIYVFFTKYFALDLDEKAGFDQGTIQRIIERPDMAIQILTIQGARILDRQLGIPVQDEANAWSAVSSPYSFSGAMQRYYGSDVARRNACAATTSNPRDEGECIQESREDFFESYALEAGQYSLTRGIANQIEDATRMPISILDADGKPTGQTTNRGIQIPRSAITDLFHGDFRSLMVISSAFSLKASLVKDDDPLANDRFFIGFSEIYLCFYSDPTMEDYARERARQSTIADLTSANGTSDGSSPAADADETPIAQPGNTQPLQINNGEIVGTPQNPTDFAREGVNDDYPVPTTPVDESRLEPNPGAAPEIIYEDGGPTEASVNAYNQWYGHHLNYENQQQQIREAQEAAVDSVRSRFRDYYQYKIMDGVLQKFNKYIPSGFTYAMYKGDNFAKTCAFIGFVENWLRNETAFGQYLGEGNLVDLYAYFRDPSEANFTRLVANSALIDRIDSYLIEHSPKIMGMTLEVGTAQAVFAFLKTGHIGQDLNFNGVEIKSLKSIYNSEWIAGKVCSWADEKLSLPAGTIKTAYDFYNNYKAAKQAVGLYNALDLDTILTTDIDDLTAFQAQAHQEYFDYLSDNKLTDSAANRTKFSDLKKNQAKMKMQQIKAEIITFIITTIFSEQIGKMEEALGLVPGTGSMLVSMGIQAALGLAIPWVQVAIFVLVNLLGYYKTIMVCTADGYYPAVERPLDGNRWDVGGLGTFDGMSSNARKENYMKAAQYKANRLVGDVYEMGMNTGDPKLVPTQTMTARWEDVDPWKHLLDLFLCPKMNRERDNNLCQGTKAGIWSNVQMQTYTHIGF